MWAIGSGVVEFPAACRRGYQEQKDEANAERLNTGSGRPQSLWIWPDVCDDLVCILVLLGSRLWCVKVEDDYCRGRASSGKWQPTGCFWMRFSNSGMCGSSVMDGPAVQGLPRRWDVQTLAQVGAGGRGVGASRIFKATLYPL